MLLQCEYPMVIVQDRIFSCHRQTVCLNQDAEVFIFNEDGLLGITFVYYDSNEEYAYCKNIVINVTKCKRPCTLQPEDYICKLRKDLVINWLKFRQESQIGQFNHFMLIRETVENKSLNMNELENKLQIAQYQLRTQIKIADDIKKEMHRRIQKTEFYTCREDLNIQILPSIQNITDLEQQYITGQMKWAEIDMENAELKIQVCQLQQQIYAKNLTNQSTSIL